MAQPDDEAGSVRLLDLTRNTTSTVGTLGSSDLVQAMVGSPEYLVWVVQHGEQTSLTTPITWTMTARDLASGRTWVVASSSEGTPVTPGLSLDGHTLVWPVYLGLKARADDVYAVDLRGGKPRRVLHDVEAGAYCIDAGILSYVVTRFTGDDYHNDVHAQTLSGRPQRLSTSGEVNYMVCGDGHVAWTEPKRGDQTRLMVVPVTGGTPVEVFGPNESEQSIGSGFVAFFDTDGRLSVTPLDGPPAGAVTFTGPPGDGAAGITTYQDLVAWSTGPRPTWKILESAVTLTR